MRKAVVVALACSALLSACSQLFSPPKSGSEYGSITVTVSSLSGAKAIVADPSDIAISAYEITVTSLDGFAARNASVKNATARFFGLEAGTWSVAVVGLDAAGKTVAWGQSPNQSVAAGMSLAVTVALSMRQAGSGSGGFSLKIAVPVSTGVDYVGGSLSKGGSQVGSLLEPSFSTEGSNLVATLAMSGLASGEYQLSLDFRRGGASGTAAGAFAETVEIYDNVISDHWQDPATKALCEERQFAAGDFFSADTSLTVLALTDESGLVTLSPPFSSGLRSYQAATTSSTFSFVATGSIDGQTLAYRIDDTWISIDSGVASGSIPVGETSTKLELRVTAGDGTATAVYSVVLYREYSIAYDANGGSGAPSGGALYRVGDTAVLSSVQPTRSGYSFIGWTTAAEGGGALYAAADSVMMGAADLILYAQWQDDRPAMRAAGTTPTAEVGFYVSGGTAFTPKIFVAAGASVQWYFTGYGGGAVSSSSGEATTTPSASYSGTMLATLSVSPWSALEGIDLGYDGGDGGSLGASYTLAQQNVTAVQRLDLAQGGLKVWCSSHNVNLGSLSFSGFSSLTTIESYFDENEDGGLVSIDLSGTPALTRLCVENNNLASLDLSGCPDLEDLRGARNAFTSMILPAGGLPRLWHLCVRSNPQLTSVLPLNAFPVLKEYYIWNCSQTGTFAPISQCVSEVRVCDNAYTSADLQGATFLANSVFEAYRCSKLASVSFGPSVPKNTNLDSCALDAAALESLLAALDASDARSGSLIVSNNPGSASVPSSAHYTSLIGKGWTITYE